MNKQQVWWTMLKSLMPPNCSCIKNKWCFKIKHNSVYQVHLVACEYSQVLTVDFSKNYLPIVNNITFFIIFLMMIHFRHLVKIVHMETTFLYGKLEEEIYIDCLHGMSDVGHDDCIILNKCIYSLVQAARQCYKKAIKF